MMTIMMLTDTPAGETADWLELHWYLKELIPVLKLLAVACNAASQPLGKYSIPLYILPSKY